MSACLAAILLGMIAGMDGQQAPWYQTTLVGMEVGPTGAQFGSDARDEGYAAQFNGRDIVEEQVAVGSEYLVIWGRDGDWAYYNSSLSPKAPGLGDRDPLREAVAAAREHQLPLIVYCVVQSGGHALREHPEYRMVDSAGNVIEGRVCLNSGYRDYVKGLVSEMLAYGIDGFHIDMVDQGFGPPYGCWCASCQPRFKAKYGVDMPTGVNWDEGWDRMLEFRYDTSADFERDLREYIRDKDPHVTVDYNYHGYPPFSFEVGQRPVQHALIGDFVTCESGVWGFGALTAGLTAQFVRATRPDNVYQVVMQRGARFYHDQTTRPLNDLRWEMFALLSNGAQVTIVDKTPFSGVMDPVAYGRIKDVFDEVHRKREHFGQPLVQEVGVYYSHRARDWYGREQKEKYQQPFFGACKALSYAHIPAGVVLDENLNADWLARFPVVLLPNVAYLSEQEAALLRAYVEGGGNLLVTGLSGLYDRMGNPQQSSSLEALIGARAIDRVTDADNYVRYHEVPGELARELPLDWPHLVYGPAVSYEPTTAQAFGEAIRAERRARQLEGKEGTEFPSSPDKTVGPALLLNEIGKGKVLTLALSPDAATASEYRTAEARKVLSNAVRFLNPKPSVRIDAPLHVETVVSDDPEARTFRVHFVAYLAPPATTSPKRPFVLPDLIEDTPLFEASVHLDRPIVSASGLNPETVVEVQDQQVDVVIHDIHEVLVVRY
ncbi:MAG: beta-galactosidase trimerization domain-containing protein [Candidatus Hydrogenedentes bacterium]|nr:beta-galactosidase trimerization domain-containing protein [Candidatus Hydrogenedentota bacterium]